MSVAGSTSKLRAITKELSVKWDLTKASWRDAKSAEFEDRYLKELFPTVDKAITAIDKLDLLLTKVRKDCE